MESITSKLQELEARISKLEEETLPKKTYPQTCPFCGWIWKSRKEHPTECVRCKRILPNVNEDNSPECIDVCKRLDALIKEKGSIQKEYGRPLFSKYIFTAVEGGIRYQKFKEGKEVENKIVSSCHEILKVGLGWTKLKEEFLDNKK
jgi:hypothetical protein